jgi:hypothetical protein
MGTFANGMTRNGGLAQADSVLAFLEQDARVPLTSIVAHQGRRAPPAKFHPARQPRTGP